MKDNKTRVKDGLETLKGLSEKFSKEELTSDGVFEIQESLEIVYMFSLDTIKEDEGNEQSPGFFRHGDFFDNIFSENKDLLLGLESIVLKKQLSLDQNFSFYPRFHIWYVNNFDQFKDLKRVEAVCNLYLEHFTKEELPHLIDEATRKYNEVDRYWQNAHTDEEKNTYYRAFDLAIDKRDLLNFVNLCFLTVEANSRIAARRYRSYVPEKIDWAIDTVSRNLWDNIDAMDENGLLPFKAEKKGSKLIANINVILHFEELEGVKISKDLTHYDKRVYTAISSFFNQGVRKVSLPDIHKAMGGNSTDLSDKQRKKLSDSLRKLRGINVKIDNHEEVDIGYNYPYLFYDGYFLPIDFLVNAETGNCEFVRILEEPPLLTFARLRNQITTFPRKLLESPGNQTDTKLAIEDFLLEQIRYIERGNNPKIKFETIFKKAKLERNLQRPRATVIELLNFYKKQGFIDSYTLDNKEKPTSITIKPKEKGKIGENSK